MVAYTAYVGDVSRFQINAIDTSTDTISAVIGSPAVYSGHYQLRVSYDNKFVAIADFNHNEVAFIDVATQTFDANVISPVTNPQVAGWAFDSTTLYISGTNQVTPGTTTTFTAGTAIPVGGAGQFTDCAITPDGKTFLFSSGTLIAWIDIASNTVTATLAGAFFGDIAITPDGQKAYCGQFSSGTGDQVAIINVPAHTLTGTIHLGGAPWPAGVRMTPDGTQALVSGNNDNTLHFITVATDTPGTSIGGGHFGGPQFIAITPDGLKAYVANQTTQTVSVIDVIGQSWLSNIAIPGASTLFGISIVPPPPGPPKKTYPGAQFIPKLFIPQKGKRDVDYTQEELTADWLAIENWSKRWVPPAPVLFIAKKTSMAPEDLTANWLRIETWANQIIGLKAPYPPVFIPRKPSTDPTDLDISFLAVQNWANRLPL